MLGHIRSDAFERFKEAFEKALKGGKGFALAARECAESFISHFNEECKGTGCNLPLLLLVYPT